MAIEKENQDLIDLEIEKASEQEITSPMMEGDALMLGDGSAIVNPMEDTSPQGAFNANLAELIPDDELESLAGALVSDYEYDKDARADWLKTYTDGLDLLGFKYEDLEDAMKNPNSPHRQEYEKIRKQNLHKMEPIPVCKIPS